jgi:3-phenylpropionate/trans-cinnamate dioxygenase ferredoxin subunit
MSEPEYQFLAKTGDVPEGGMKCFEIDGRNVLLIHAAGGVFRAIENRCSHEKKSLEGGRVRGGGKKIVCPHHGANFDLETGKALTPPAVLPLTVYPVMVDDDDVMVKLIEEKKGPANPFAIPGAGGGFAGGF